jgi:hypothetical protein
MKTKLGILVVFMAFIYICAILIDAKLNPLEWSNQVRMFSLILFIASGLILLMVDGNSLKETKTFEPDHDWDAEVRSAR